MSVNLKEMLSEFVYGGMDGVITTVAIIAGTMGADISTKYALILGLANILADGFSTVFRDNSLVEIVASNSELSRTSPILSAMATFSSCPNGINTFVSFYVKRRERQYWKMVNILIPSVLYS